MPGSEDRIPTHEDVKSERVEKSWQRNIEDQSSCRPKRRFYTHSNAQELAESLHAGKTGISSRSKQGASWALDNQVSCALMNGLIWSMRNATRRSIVNRRSKIDLTSTLVTISSSMVLGHPLVQPLMPLIVQEAHKSLTFQ